MAPTPPLPAHTLPWWRRLERRWVLSVAKRLAADADGRAIVRRVPGLRDASRRFLARVARAQVTVCGAPFRLDVLRRSVSRSVFLGGRWHADVVRMLREHVGPGMTAADVGANIGYMAAHMGEVAGPEGTVLALEPEPRNFSILAENARRMRWRNVVPIQAAVGDVSGTATLFLSPRDGGDHRIVAAGDGRHGVPVPLVTLDALAAQRRTEIHFVKMDIQGAEAAAIRGGRDVLRRPAMRGLVLEFWPDALREAGEDPFAVLAAIRDAGLRCANDRRVDDAPHAFLAAMSGRASKDLLFLRP